MDSHTHSGPAGRLEVVETGRRRRWSIEEAQAADVRVGGIVLEGGTMSSKDEPLATIFRVLNIETEEARLDVTQQLIED